MTPVSSAGISSSLLPDSSDIYGNGDKLLQKEGQNRRNELDRLLAREQELDTLFERIYEDNVMGKLSDERYRKLSQRYEDEYAHLKQKIVILNREIAKEENHITNTDDFLNVIGKYTDMKNLTREMIIAFIQHIDVYHVENRSGEKFQRIRIHYNLVVWAALPEREGLPKP